MYINPYPYISCCSPKTTSSGCSVRLPGECVYYSGSNIIAPGIVTGDNFNTVINKLSNFSFVNTQDTSTITLSGSGEASSPLRADVVISDVSDNVLVDNNGLYVPEVIIPTPHQYHGNTALVTKSGNDTTAATAFITLSPSGRAWDWNFPFLTLSAANTASIEPSTIVVEAGTYTAVTLTKSTTISANPGVIIPNITCTTSNKIINVIGKPNMLPASDVPAIWTDSGTTGSFNIGTITGDCGIFFRGRSGQISYLDADSIIISEDNGFLNGAIHNGAIGHGATLYANVDFIQNTYVSGPLVNETVGIISRGTFAVTYITSKIIRASCGALIGGDGQYYGTVSANFGGKLHVKANLIENFGTGRAIAVGGSATDLISIDCNEVRVSSSTVEAGRMQNALAKLYFKSGCRVVAGSSSTYAIVGVGEIYIDGTVYSNKPLDPALVLKTGTWIVDPDIT
jgi:hypothetical protein